MISIKNVLLGSALALGLFTACDTEDDSTESVDSLASISGIVSTSDNFTTLNAALEAAELDSVLAGEGPFTVFAPTDEAFDALPEGTLEALLDDIPKLTKILQQHVVAGNFSSSAVLGEDALTSLFGQDLAVSAEGPSIGGVIISSVDIPASNGVIHVIDAVLIPRDIVEEANYRGFTTLVAALENAGITDALKADGPLTVFAPTNEAFAAVDGLDAILDDTNKDPLVAILKNHVVSGENKAEVVVGLSEVETLNNEQMSVEVVDGEVMLNGSSKVTATDVMGLNGVIHVIDTVITTVN